MIISSTDGQVVVGDEWISREEAQIGDCKVSVGSRNCEERETIAVTIKLEEPRTLFSVGIEEFREATLQETPDGQIALELHCTLPMAEELSSLLQKVLAKTQRTAV
jgi:hypothetical protein